MKKVRWAKNFNKGDKALYFNNGSEEIKLEPGGKYKEVNDFDAARIKRIFPFVDVVDGKEAEANVDKELKEIKEKKRSFAEKIQVAREAKKGNVKNNKSKK